MIAARHSAASRRAETDPARSAPAPSAPGRPPSRPGPLSHRAMAGDRRQHRDRRMPGRSPAAPCASRVPPKSVCTRKSPARGPLQHRVAEDRRPGTSVRPRPASRPPATNACTRPPEVLQRPPFSPRTHLPRAIRYVPNAVADTRGLSTARVTPHPPGQPRSRAARPARTTGCAARRSPPPVLEVSLVGVPEHGLGGVPQRSVLPRTRRSSRRNSDHRRCSPRSSGDRRSRPRFRRARARPTAPR